MKQGKTLNTTKLEQQAPTAKDFILSRDPNKAMREMMDTIDSLRGLYETENEALNKGDTKTFMALQNTKIGRAFAYQSGMEQLSERKAELANVDPALRQKLMDMQSEFSQITEANLKALERSRKSVERLSNRIMDSARQAARSNRVKYSATGNLEEHEGRVSIGVNERA